FKAFKITNTSVVGELVLSNLKLSSTPNFSIFENFSKTRLIPGETASFVVRLNTNVAGNFTTKVSFRTNSSTQDSFSFNVQGQVTVQESCSDDQIDNRDIQLLSTIELKDSILDLLDVESDPELYLPSDEAIRGQVYGVPRASQNYVLFYTNYI